MPNIINTGHSIPLSDCNYLTWLIVIHGIFLMIGLITICYGIVEIFAYNY